MLDWLENVSGRCPGALLNLLSMLCLDAFRGHLTHEIKNKIHRLKSELVVIPAGMRSAFQPLDVSVNKPFKARLSEQYDRWISSAWTRIPAELVTKSFKKCCISNALDGTEDGLLWDDDKDSDVDDPSSDYLPSDCDDAGEDEDSA